MGSTPGEVEIVPTPRMNKVVSLFEALVRKLTLGTWLATAPRVLRLARSRSSPPITDTATGTFCSGSARRVAVTVTSCTVPSSGLAAVVDCWAWARLATEASMASVRAWRRKGV